MSSRVHANSVNNIQSMQSISKVQNLLLPKMIGFKLASLNITGLVKHIEELRVFLYPMIRLII